MTIKPCKLCDKPRFANTSWCLDHYKEREKEKAVKKKDKSNKTKKVKKKTNQQIKKTIHNRVWKLMSKYIRLKYADKQGKCKCYTCDVVKNWKELQAGHFKHDRLDFDERNLKPQCLTAESNIKMLDGSYRSISEIQVGDLISAFNEETFKKDNACVIGAKSFTPDKLYEIELENGERFYATGDHKIVANNKWHNIENILNNFSGLDIKEI